MQYHTLNREELVGALHTADTGLDLSEAGQRLEHYGPNEIERKKRKNYLKEYFVQFTHFFAVLLELAAVLSFLADLYSPGEGYDVLGYAIFGAVVVNATFAFWQEYKADRTVDALLKLIPSLVKVRRGGEIAKVDARLLVPGDILIVEEGDRIGADAVILEANSLYVNIATLTGESRPVRRFPGADRSETILDAKNVLFAGTTVESGNGVAAVFGTGRNTEFGKIASLAKEVKKRLTPMQTEIIRITRILTVAALLVGGVFFLLGFFSGQGFLIAAIFALSLIVANVPEGMLPTITLSLSLASQNMARRNALIKNLDSVQTLGSATVICTDKTGTITRNEMTLKEIYLAGGETISITGEGYDQDGEFVFAGERSGADERLHFFLLAGMLNCRATIEENGVFGDPTELSIIAAARKGRIENNGYAKLQEFPFTSERKMMSTSYEKGGETFIFSKGALEVLLPLSDYFVDDAGRVMPFDESNRARLVARAEDLERKAYRVLAVAYGRGEEERGFIMLGLVAIMDLPRSEVFDAIATCRRAGIRVLMLTGDNPLTAEAIARTIGLQVDLVLTGDETRRMPDEKLEDLLKHQNVLFARMRSEQKLRIASLLQRNGEVVAMTGDGVNDAPALRKADIGISMGTKGTEVAKEAADMILLDDNFASIVAAIEEGRTVYFNIKKFVTYILSSNIPEIVPYILQFFLRIPLPLSVIQILSIDLGSDLLPGLALGSEAPEEDIMDRPPVGKNERILDWEVFKRGYFFLGAIEGAAAMVAFLGFLFLSGWQYGDLSVTGTTLHRQAMTMTLLGAVSCQLFNVWTLRSWDHSSFQRGAFTNRLLIIAIAIEILWVYALLNVQAVQVIFNTAHVPAQYLWILLPFPILLFLSHELYKYLRRPKMVKSEF
ncbi:ATPase, P-type (transporting), HAD superfamily, subfamily IC [Methanofollis liminatans DSM 4140]|uniref:ATPase, P-type (Transporting), HAD superfamily, subfamily IC n=1 Tax=Methanofollis liminatans DSM 4140 TaxID=28892 RepID=J1L261_9EURY|nr:cation-transporting P-type ATPase [Methanofollis liminatans]EJG07132.1 ATPase, P-type (transporting), HAD superfamily, subfamily IC [Methanofollis liminatans DSM 4140]